MNRRLYPALFLICLLTTLIASQAQAQGDYVRLQIVERPDHYLHVEKGEPEFGEVEPGWVSARWELRQIGNKRPLYVLRNLWTGRYLTLSDGKLTTVAELTVDPRTGEGPDLWKVERRPNNPTIVSLTQNSTGKFFPMPLPSDLRLEPPAPVKAAPEFPKIDQEDYVRIQLVAKPDQYLHVEKDQPEFGEVGPGWISARWELRPVGRNRQVFILQSLWTGKYLTLSDGKLTTVAELRVDPRTGEGPDLWKVKRNTDDTTIVSLTQSSTGKFFPVPIYSELRFEIPAPKVKTVQVVYYRLRSATSPDAVVHIEKGPPAAGKVLPGWYSAQWEMSDRGSGDGRYVTFKNRWTEKYLMVKNGALTLDDAEVDPRTGQGPHLWRVIGQRANPSHLILQHTGSKLFLQLGKPKASGDGWDLNLVEGNGDSAWTFEVVN